MKERIVSKWNDKTFRECIIICFITAFFSFIYFIFCGQGVFVVRDDFNSQQIPFTIALHNALKHGLDGWTWNLDLGTSTIQGFSFYELGSPFFWITMLFPTTWFPYIIGWIYIIKYVFAGIISFEYLCRFTHNPRYATIGALLYSFSGFQTTNLEFYHFHDVVAFFPLLLIGIEKVMEDKKNKKYFIFAVFINSLINYFFFVQEVVFLILYFLFRFGTKDIKELLRRIRVCTICGLCGLAMSSILFLPNVLYILGNPRSETQLYLSNLVWDAKNFIYILKGLLLPGEAMHDQSSVIPHLWNSTSCYLPMVGLVPVISYITEKRDWLSKLLKTLLLISFSPILSSAFLMFTSTYQRWWYMLAMMMALVSVLVLENMSEYNIKKSIIINVIAVIGFYILIRYMKWSQDGGSLVFHQKRLLGYFLISLSGIILIWRISKQKKFQCDLLIVGVSVFAVVTTVITLFFYRVNSVQPKEYKNQILIYSQLECFDEQYRYNSSDNLLTLCGDVAGLSSFSSTVTNSIWDFDSLFDYHYPVQRMDKNEIPGLTQLLAGKYYVTQDANTENIIQEYENNGLKYYVVEEKACPIGYAVKKYISYDDLMSIDKNQRGIALLSAAVIKSEDEEKIIGKAEKVGVDNIDFNKTIDEYVDENLLGAVKDFSRDDSGFSCYSNYNENTLVYFSVPNDAGWHAYIDGKRCEIIDSSGMMLLNVPKGSHSIRFSYSTPGYNIGKWISIISILSFTMYCFLIYRRKKQFDA